MIVLTWKPHDRKRDWQGSFPCRPSSHLSNPAQQPGELSLAQHHKNALFVKVFCTFWNIVWSYKPHVVHGDAAKTAQKAFELAKTSPNTLFCPQFCLTKADNILFLLIPLVPLGPGLGKGPACGTLPPRRAGHQSLPHPKAGARLVPAEGSPRHLPARQGGHPRPFPPPPGARAPPAHSRHGGAAPRHLCQNAKGRPLPFPSRARASSSPSKGRACLLHGLLRVSPGPRH